MTMTTWDHERANAAATDLRGRLISTIAPVLPRGTRVALLDYPAHYNVGDSAIWLGELALLETLGVSIRYVAAVNSFDPDRLRRRLGPDGTVLIHGGGNFGDLWPWHHELRLRAGESLRDYPLIQLPQSIYFQDPEKAEHTRKVFSTHPNFTLFVRDQPSMERANELGFQGILCTDSFFAMGFLPGPPPTKDVVWQSRYDKEAPSKSREADGDIPREDWAPERRTIHSLLLGASRRLLGSPDGIKLQLYNAMARARFDRGCLLLNRGRVLVTNRLHGQLMAILMGVPHFVSDTKWGKVGDFYRTWLESYLPGLWCATEEEALARGRALARALGPGQSRPSR